uniref:uncharacterized protein LOC122605932 n=1 Tax=Erigeron canadensis TaxID=72917 RepID=UPI001CB97A67|nr:uncharacterized protein LOC122605932 [Erigeron canadensis]
MENQTVEEVNDSATPSSDAESHFHFTVQSNKRSKRDIAWRHVSLSHDEFGKNIYTCDYCKNVFRGGGIFRMKQHLAGIKGSVKSCFKVPRDVKFEMLRALGHKVSGGVGIVKMETEDASSSKNAAPKTSLGKRNTSCISDNRRSCFQQGIQDPSQPSIKSIWHSKERIHDADLAIALWLYDAGIPLSVVNSPYFPIAMSKIAAMGNGYKGPSSHAMRVSLLADAKQSVNLIVDSYRERWSEIGCTIMSDGWRDSQQRPLINFLVYCSKGISFIKSVDASDIESNAEDLCNLFAEIVETVGCSNIVHFVTENGANYKAAGSLLEERYPMICWSPCSTHCINLILKDISELDDVADLITLASQVTVFIYNHKWSLNWLRKRDGWTEIIQPGATRFDTSFIALNSLHEQVTEKQLS